MALDAVELEGAEDSRTDEKMAILEGQFAKAGERFSEIPLVGVGIRRERRGERWKCWVKGGSTRWRIHVPLPHQQ